MWNLFGWHNLNRFRILCKHHPCTDMKVSRVNIKNKLNKKSFFSNVCVNETKIKKLIISVWGKIKLTGKRKGQIVLIFVPKYIYKTK